MILYNVTISVESEIENAWVEWMKTKHIDEVLATGLFEKATFYKVLFQKDETTTYSVQYITKNLAKLQQYQAKFAIALQEMHTQKFGSKAVAFRTVLEEV